MRAALGSAHGGNSKKNSVIHQEYIYKSARKFQELELGSNKGESLKPIGEG